MTVLIIDADFLLLVRCFIKNAADEIRCHLNNVNIDYERKRLEGDN
jgi:hypothetical protein